MSDRDPDHWLFRLDQKEWLRAADNELLSARQAFVAKQQRPAVAHARRAAGMAINALLRVAPDPAYGRSYMDHLGALSKDPAAPEEVREAAGRLLRMPLAQEIVVLGKGQDTQAEPAALIIGYVRGLIAPPAQA